MFEDYLKALHASKHTHDDFKTWKSKLSNDDLIQYADDFYESQLNKALSIINSTLK